MRIGRISLVYRRWFLQPAPQPRLVWSRSMSTMEGMLMPGGWSMSMTWMPGSDWSASAFSFLGMWVVMMIAMMMPSLVPMLVRYRKAIGEKFARARGLALIISRVQVTSLYGQFSE